MIVITGHVVLKPEHRDEAVRLSCEHSTRSRGEAGCISHNCYLDAENANRLHFFERWADMEAVQVHFAVPQSGEFIRQVAALAAGRPDISIFDASELETPEL